MGGKATLAIMPLTWKSGWPEVEVVRQMTPVSARSADLFHFEYSRHTTKAFNG